MAKTSFQKWIALMLAGLALSLLLWPGVGPASAQNIVDEWAAVQPPKPPALKSVTLDPKTTALLVLDLVKRPVMPRGGHAVWHRSLAFKPC